jgi:hypothetical protein
MRKSISSPGFVDSGSLGHQERRHVGLVAGVEGLQQDIGELGISREPGEEVVGQHLAEVLDLAPDRDPVADQ